METPEREFSCEVFILQSCRLTGDNDKPEKEEETVFTGVELYKVDDMLLDLEPENSGNSVPIADISQPAPVLPSPDTLWMGKIPYPTCSYQSVADNMAALLLPQPQRTVSSFEIPQTSRNQLKKSHLQHEDLKMNIRIRGVSFSMIINGEYF